MPGLPSWLPIQIKTLLVYGGSFDPIHYAHLTLPEIARQAVGADMIAYIPAGTPPHKQAQARTPGHHRLAMVQLALEGNQHAVALSHELDRAILTGKPSFTVDTLEGLAAELGPGVKLRLLMGADMLAIFPKWYRFERILELADPVVMVRPPTDKRAMLNMLPSGLDVGQWESRVVEVEPNPISSTLVRLRVQQGQDIHNLVPDKVAGYIREHGLYL